GASPLARVRDEWVYLEREVLHPARWIEGARVSERRQADQSRFVSALAKDAPRIDPVSTKIRWAQREAAAPPPAQSSELDLGRSEVAAAIRASADAPRQPSETELRRRREMEL